MWQACAPACCRKQPAAPRLSFLRLQRGHALHVSSVLVRSATRPCAAAHGPVFSLGPLPLRLLAGPLLCANQPLLLLWCPRLLLAFPRPNVVLQIKNYSAPNAAEGRQRARSDIPFLFKAFETGQAPPPRPGTKKAEVRQLATAVMACPCRMEQAPGAEGEAGVRSPRRLRPRTPCAGRRRSASAPDSLRLYCMQVEFRGRAWHLDWAPCSPRPSLSIASPPLSCAVAGSARRHHSRVP